MGNSSFLSVPEGRTDISRWWNRRYRDPEDRPKGQFIEAANFINSNPACVVSINRLSLEASALEEMFKKICWRVVFQAHFPPYLMETIVVGGGQIRYDAVWEAGGRGADWVRGWGFNDLVRHLEEETAAGRALAHLQGYDIGMRSVSIACREAITAALAKRAAQRQRMELCYTLAVVIVAQSCPYGARVSSRRIRRSRQWQARMGVTVVYVDHCPLSLRVQSAGRGRCCFSRDPR